MKEHLRSLVIALVLLGLGGWSVYWWFDNMELRANSFWSTSRALAANPYLGATTVLGEHGHPARYLDTLNAIKPGELGQGMLLLYARGGPISAQQGMELRAWVERGNTLVVLPRYGYATPEPFSSALGLTVTEGVHLNLQRCHPQAAPVPEPKNRSIDRSIVRLSCVSLPNSPYPLELRGDDYSIKPRDGAPAAEWTDTSAELVRAYRQGAGHIVILGSDFFSQAELPRHDHAEFLLKLAALDQAKGSVHIVGGTEAMPWRRALWLAWPHSLSALGLLLLCWFGLAVRRFGPMLPEPSVERRAMLEHIDASGRWLWRLPAGRQLLLGAARRRLTALLQRRLPELHALARPDQARHLAEASGLPLEQVRAALYELPASQPAAFTHQIHTLQLLRLRYER